jgi:hypothetical protein
MATKVEPNAEFHYEGRPVSALGFRLRRIREQIDAAAKRGEIHLLTDEELDRELDELRRRDSDVR